MLRFYIAGLFLLLVSWPASAYADAIGDARAARDTGDFARAWSLLAPWANNGDLKAMVELGDLFAMSDLPDGKARATKFYQAAAQRGSLAGQQRLRAIGADKPAPNLVIPPGVGYQEHFTAHPPTSPEAAMRALASFTPSPADIPPGLPDPAVRDATSIVHVTILIDALTPLTDELVTLQSSFEQQHPGQVSFEWIAPVRQLAVRGGGRRPSSLEIDPTGRAMEAFGAKRLPTAIVATKRDGSRRFVALGEVAGAIRSGL